MSRLFPLVLVAGLAASTGAHAQTAPELTQCQQARTDDAARLARANSELERLRETVKSLQQQVEQYRPYAQAVADAEALNLKGLSYYQQGDYESALPLFRKAAEANHADAIGNLAMLYLNGRGVAQDVRQAEALLQRASALGSRAASENLAAMYANALGVHYDPSRAIKWYQVALSQGSTIAQAQLDLLRQGRRR